VPAIDGDTFEIGVDHQLAITAIQGQLQLIRNHAARRQRLVTLSQSRVS
jgi:hypothetical protein